MTYINVINLNTGALSRAERSSVSDAALAVVVPWLRSIIANGARTPLPAPLAEYDAAAYVEHGSLVATIFAGNDPLVTLGVSQRSRHGEELWSMLLANFEHNPGIQRPREPWLAVAAHPAILAHSATSAWLADFEQCAAWAWITRNVQIESAK